MGVGVAVGVSVGMGVSVGSGVAVSVGVRVNVAVAVTGTEVTVGDAAAGVQALTSKVIVTRASGNLAIISTFYFRASYFKIVNRLL